MKWRHIILGLVCWLLAVAACSLSMRAELDGQSSSLTDLITAVQQWVTGARQPIEATSDIPLYIALDDPIFIAAPDGRFLQAGYVSDVDGSRSRDPVEVDQVRAVVYESAVAQFPQGYRLDYFTTPMNLDWVIKMMIPEDRQEEIRELIETQWTQHQHDVMTQLQPVMAEGLRRATDAIEAELPAIIDAHREEFRSLGDRFEVEILQQELLPLVRHELFPTIQEEAEPLARDIGRSLWDRVSLFSFTWRYLYDISPLPERDAVNTEFQRFIDQEAIPELETRSEQFVEVTRAVTQRVMENERVRSTIKNSTQRVMEDPELRKIVGRIVREATVDNIRLRSDLRDYWNSHETQLAVRMASNRFEMMVRTIGDLIFGTREQGITPEFSRILRSQILRKDRRWFVMVPLDSETPSDSISISFARVPMLYPLEFGGLQQSPLTPGAAVEDDPVSAD